MAKCDVCGNEYDKTREIIAAGSKHTFDSGYIRGRQRSRRINRG
jgi:hypothetical protein